MKTDAQTPVLNYAPRRRFRLRRRTIVLVLLVLTILAGWYWWIPLRTWAVIHYRIAMFSRAISRLESNAPAADQLLCTWDDYFKQAYAPTPAPPSTMPTAWADLERYQPIIA